MKRVLVTGGNRGYGLALIRACLDRGDRVWATCRATSDAAELRALAENRTLSILECDVGSETDIVRLSDTVAAETDALDILINNAGQLGGDDLETVTGDWLMDMFRVNAVAPLMISRALLELLAAGDSPCIMMSSSSWGSLWYKTDPTNNAPDRVFGYCSSKAALNMISRTLASALKPRGITVLMHHPGGRGDPGGGPTREESAAATLSLIDAHGIEDTGKFYHWRGHEFPW